MQSKFTMRATAIGAVCALAGAGAGIAGAGAATKSPTRSAGTTNGAMSIPRDGGPRGGHDRAVHAVETVLNKAGTAYISETEDNGTVKSVSGSDVTITEGTTAVPYQDVTVTIPSGATIQRNGSSATVADLKAGDDIHVSVSDDGTTVFAHDSTFRPAGGPGGPGGHRGPGGPGRGAPPASPSPAPSSSTTTG
ncbi:hypothetical protein NBH00_01975 [Paraconexibacter antarcticus]|uniref:DUF5666 domain-containing protein n=1 Tax=Paraconexibacter antarcticus TaxID=2949664 RepID=A0ABY5DSI3_9ACTN|nr:hypothetical protein [Paraconexibacter antarcticus]UTI64986.1 hypothetical protein NBH00_01975 [Paraconexibacter antarcticus]